MPLPPLRSIVRQFWDQIVSGAATAEAAAFVGVSASTGEKWFADAGGVNHGGVNRVLLVRAQG